MYHVKYGYHEEAVGSNATGKMKVDGKPDMPIMPPPWSRTNSKTPTPFRTDSVCDSGVVLIGNTESNDTRITGKKEPPLLAQRGFELLD
jgi:hypothetical protein